MNAFAISSLHAILGLYAISVTVFILKSKSCKYRAFSAQGSVHYYADTVYSNDFQGPLSPTFPFDTEFAHRMNK
jgi:hypothetical protein